MMRTTMNIDDRLLSSLKETALRSGKPLKQVVNEALRLGLRDLEHPQPRPYHMRPVSMGAVRPGADLDKARHLADSLEDEAIAGKMEHRK